MHRFRHRPGNPDNHALGNEYTISSLNVRVVAGMPFYNEIVVFSTCVDAMSSVSIKSEKEH